MITITQNAIYHSTFSLKVTAHDSDDVQEIKSEDLIYHMQDLMDIGNDVTFGRLFQIILDNREFLDIFYRSLLGDTHIIDFIEEFSKKSSKKNNDYTVIISWGNEYYDTVDARSFFEYIQIHGVKTNKIHEKNVEDFIFSLEFTPLNELKQKKLMISNYFEIVDNSYFFDKFNNNEESSIDESASKIFVAESKQYTVYDIIYCILFHVSYHGTPEEREEMRRDSERNSAINEAAEPDGLLQQPMTDEEYKQKVQQSMIEDNERFKNMKTFWEKIYPNDKVVSNFRENVDPFENAALLISQTVGLSIEEQIREAVNNEEYEKAEKLNKLLNKKKNKK